MHPGFVDLKTFCPGVIVQMNYATTDNFTGEVVPGYRAQKALLAKEAAELLANVQKEALSSGLSLKIFDSYRPKKAVQFFIEWAEKRESNPELKQLYYPRYTRKEILDNGFIARQSSHSRGSAVDLTLVDLKTGNELDMGTIFDYFDEASHTDSAKVDYEQKKNRQILKSMMESAGFSNFRQEWWHYSLRPGPYPDQYFDFDIV
jgi:D-alanyl-D-alanine dipeptidase